jgi:shikimate dehydrogenase
VTLRYLVLGDPVAHSLSPAMMTAAFRAAGLDAEYAARRVTPEELPGAMRELHRDGIAGANVTVPHKRAALSGAVAVTATARSIGAVNTLVRRDDGWEGDNTDGPGFGDWVAQLGLGGLLRREALVLGAGGSARAVTWALLQAGCPRVRVANRTRSRADELARDLRDAGGDAERIAGEAPGGAAVPGGLVVNCTPLGLRAGDPPPIGAAALEGAGAYLDLVYPSPPGVLAARQAGVRAEDGAGLLVAQGALSFARWTGRVADVTAMRAAVDRELTRRA